MNKVGLFLKHVAPYQLQYNINVLKNYFPLIRDRHNVKSALDVGCGPGDLTSAIFQFVEQDINEMIGIDISPVMVDWANKAYGGVRIYFSKVDVQTIPKDFENRFDCIFSFWTLHWITDQSVNMHQAPFQKSANPQRELVEILEHVGFKDISCNVETVRFGNYTENDIAGFFFALSPYYDYIPINLRMEFIRDHVHLVDTEQDASGQRHYYFDHTMFVVHGCKKP
uniref:Methyltransferase domain-containing protein n=1 Tax=Photinus pyralis TaxID=7054 RepID=A0A1Y1LBN4_PHOPY